MSPIAKRTGVPQIAESNIESNQTAQALLQAQFAWQEKQRDLDVRYVAERDKLRAEYLETCQAVMRGE